MSMLEAELASQPAVWERAAALGAAHPDALAPPARTAIFGCGTSYYVAQVMAAVREARGGQTDAFPASEVPVGRAYDLWIAVTRSGTTSEVSSALEALPPGARRLVITAVPRSPIAHRATDVIALDFADEKAVVQTRFATAVIAFTRACLGEDLTATIADARRALDDALPFDPQGMRRFVFLGAGWTYGLANEAALKLREAAGAWTESYHAMEFRHGPISACDERTAVWMLGEADEVLRSDIVRTGAKVIESDLDPLARLVQVHRMAVELARAKGLDPDRPRFLSRSVVLT